MYAYFITVTTAWYTSHKSLLIYAPMYPQDGKIKQFLTG